MGSFNIFKSLSFFLKVPRSGGEPGIFLIFSFIFSHKQRLRPLGYCAPHSPLSFNQCHWLTSATLINFSSENLLEPLGIEPGAAGWKVSMPPQCYMQPPCFNKIFAGTTRHFEQSFWAQISLSPRRVLGSNHELKGVDVLLTIQTINVFTLLVQ